MEYLALDEQLSYIQELDYEGLMKYSCFNEVFISTVDVVSCGVESRTSMCDPHCVESTIDIHMFIVYCSDLNSTRLIDRFVVQRDGISDSTRSYRFQFRNGLHACQLFDLLVELSLAYCFYLVSKIDCKTVVAPCFQYASSDCGVAATISIARARSKSSNCEDFVAVNAWSMSNKPSVARIQYALNNCRIVGATLAQCVSEEHACGQEFGEQVMHKVRMKMHGSTSRREFLNL